MASQNGFTVWLTGMSGTGKTTIANYIAARLRQVNRNVEILDEADVANELWKGIGDTKEDRVLTVKRLGFVSSLLSRNNVAVLAAAVSPYKASREENRRAIGRYVEVYVDCPTDKLIERDSTGKYKKALAGEIPNFIGITEPYEPPNSPEVTIHSDHEAVEEGARKVFQALLDLGYMTTDELKVITGKKMKAQPLPKKGARREVAAPPAKKAAPAARPAARTARAQKPAPKKAGKKK
ncbi:MAG: adenylyl-sulfate kinase [Myxococcota bacterium]|nr:adenylyl-sulfate kinase [Myxococcota bacterium]